MSLCIKLQEDVLYRSIDDLQVKLMEVQGVNMGVSR